MHRSFRDSQRFAGNAATPVFCSNFFWGGGMKNNPETCPFSLQVTYSCSITISSPGSHSSQERNKIAGSFNSEM